MDWNGNVTAAEAIDLARNGWTDVADEADRLARAITRQVIATQDTLTWAFPQDVTGESLDVATFLTGVPECWMNPVPLRTVAPAKTVRIVIATGMFITVSPDAYRRRGAAIVALIDTINDAGYRVEVWGWAAATAETGRHRISHAYLIQSADQQVNISRIMFALAHPAAHRRINFMARIAHDTPVELREPFDGMGLTVNGDPEPGDLPPMADERTLVVQAIQPRQAWSFEDSVRWITDTLDRL